MTEQAQTSHSAPWGDDVYSLLSWFRRDRVQQAHVMVVGCGALGNEVMKNLALFGFGHVHLVDYDHIEQSNLSRSILFRPADALSHRPKVEVAARRIREINPSVQVHPIQGDITHDVGLGLLQTMDVVIGCVDNRWARYCLNRLCMRAGVPWVDGGIEGLEGTARVFRPGQNCYACNLGPEALKELAHKRSCTHLMRRHEQAQRVATTPVVASIIGAVQVQEALKLIHQQELEEGKFTSLCGKMFYYEGQHLTSRLATFRAYDDDCPVHERWTPILPSPLSAALRVDETIAHLRNLLGEEEVEFSPGNHRFVDFLHARQDGSRIKVMCPDYAVANAVAQNPDIGSHLPDEWIPHTYHTVNKCFPYPELTLTQLGVAPWEVLQVTTPNGIHYVELTADAARYTTILNPYATRL